MFHCACVLFFFLISRYKSNYFIDSFYGFYFQPFYVLASASSLGDIGNLVTLVIALLMTLIDDIPVGDVSKQEHCFMRYL